MTQKTNNEHCLWPGAVTTKQERTLELIKEALSREEKIIVFSERPDFQKLMQQELRSRNIKSNVFIGSQGIKSRNVVTIVFLDRIFSSFLPPLPSDFIYCQKYCYWKNYLKTGYLFGWAYRFRFI